VDVGLLDLDDVQWGAVDIQGVTFEGFGKRSGWDAGVAEQ